MQVGYQVVGEAHRAIDVFKRTGLRYAALVLPYGLQISNSTIYFLQTLRNAMGEGAEIQVRWELPAGRMKLLLQEPQELAKFVAEVTLETADRVGAGVVSGWQGLSGVAPGLMRQWILFEKQWIREVMPEQVVAFGFDSSYPVEWGDIVSVLVEPNVKGVAFSESWGIGGNEAFLEHRSCKLGRVTAELENTVAEFYEELPEAADAVAALPFYVTETGFTRGHGAWAAGWKDAGLPSPVYADSIRRYLSSVEAVSRVAGVALRSIASAGTYEDRHFGVSGESMIERALRDFRETV